MTAILLLCSVPVAAQTPWTCPDGTDVVVAFKRDGNVRGYVGIDVDSNTAHYCSGDRNTSWAANYAPTVEGFDFDLLARNGTWRRTMSEVDGELVDTWNVEGSEFRTVVVHDVR